MNSDLLIPIHTKSHQFSFQECWSICDKHKLPDATPTMSTANLKWHINLLFGPDSLPVSTSDNLTRPPLLLLPFFPLAAPVNTLVSQCPQLVKATVLAESSGFYLLTRFSPLRRCLQACVRQVSHSSLLFDTFMMKINILFIKNDFGHILFFFL